MKISDKRGEIMKAALELIAEQGFHGAPMSEIARKAGVAAGTIYRYFENRDVLITELHRELEFRIAAFLKDDYPTGNETRTRFLYFVQSLLRYFIANPLHFRYMEQYFNSPYGISRRREMLSDTPGNHDLLMNIFLQGIKQQVLKDLPISVLFSLAFGPILILLRDHILGFNALNETMIRRTTEACWDAIKR